MARNITNIRTVNPVSRAGWRKWLSKNHKSTEPVLLVIYNKDSGSANLTYDEAVEEALCFGWIDNWAIRRDEESSYRQFVPRKPNSNWSKLNRQRAEKMIARGLMRKSGKVFIDEAKQNGKWDASRAADNLPGDLKKALARDKTARLNFDTFPPSTRRMIIQWILEAKRDETRAKRISDTVKLAAKNIRAR